MSSASSEQDLIYAKDLTRDDVRALERFLNTEIGRVSDNVGETGETAFAVNALIILISSSAGVLDFLLEVEHPSEWQKAMIVHEWQRLRGIAHPFNHCDGYDHQRWWNRIDRYDQSEPVVSQHYLAQGTSQHTIEPDQR